MDNQTLNLKDLAKHQEYSEQTAKITLLLDFIKNVIPVCYNAKFKGQELTSEETTLLSSKYQELQALINEIIPSA